MFTHVFQEVAKSDLVPHAGNPRFATGSLLLLEVSCAFEWDDIDWLIYKVGYWTLKT